MIFVPRTFRMIRLGAVHMLLAAACCFTVFPFLWMAVSSLKTKAEVMAADAFLPSTPQYGNYLEIVFHSPIPRYLANSLLWRSAWRQSRLCAVPFFAYGVTFMRIRGRDMLFRLVLFYLYGADCRDLYSLLYHTVQVRAFRQLSGTYPVKWRKRAGNLFAPTGI